MGKKVDFVGPPDVIGGFAGLLKTVRDNNPGPAVTRLSPAAVPAAAPAAPPATPSARPLILTLYGDDLRQLVKDIPNDGVMIYLPEKVIEAIITAVQSGQSEITVKI